MRPVPRHPALSAPGNRRPGTRFLPARVAGCLLLAGGLSVQAAETTTVPTEASFLDELPVVLSVSRLAQPLDETPGAVTVIDREMIRRSGARELAELLRLVPGFIVSHFDGGARPFASYHADYDAYNRRLQVYIDGRTVYSCWTTSSASRCCAAPTRPPTAPTPSWAW